jgi:hypothetical protein
MTRASGSGRRVGVCNSLGCRGAFCDDGDGDEDFDPTAYGLRSVIAFFMSISPLLAHPLDEAWNRTGQSTSTRARPIW